MPFIAKTIEISPFVNIAGNRLDVREVVAQFEKNEIFGYLDHGNPITNKLTMLPDVADLKAIEIDELFSTMCHFAYIRWNPGYSQSNQQGRPGYIFISAHSPDELVAVKRPDQDAPATMIVPREILGTRDADPGWEIIAQYMLNENA